MAEIEGVIRTLQQALGEKGGGGGGGPGQEGLGGAPEMVAM